MTSSKYISAFLFLSLFSQTLVFLHSQNPGKGFKYLEEGNCQEAKAIFRELTQADPNDIAGNYGLSRYYGHGPCGETNKEKALEHLLLTEEGFRKADASTKASLEKYDITAAQLKTRRERIEASFFEEAKKEKSVAALQGFLDQFPKSTFVIHCTNLRDEMELNAARDAGVSEAITAFIAKYPETEYLKEAIAERNALAMKEAIALNTSVGFRKYLANFPEAKEAPQAAQLLAAAAFYEAKASNKAEDFRAYIKEFPDAVFIMQAKEILAKLESE